MNNKNHINKLLDKISNPKDLKKLKINQLPTVCEEVRNFMIEKVSKTGGHLGAGLGVVELTVALHYVFNTPKDKLVWDVSHQCYPHKLITGRRDRIKTLRKGGGLSGFTKRSESEYDPFGAAHSSTSISSTLGMAVALAPITGIPAPHSKPTSPIPPPENNDPATFRFIYFEASMPSKGKRLIEIHFK